MSDQLEVFLEIPKISGKIIIPNDQNIIYIGKREIKESVTKSLGDPLALDSISSVRRDKNSGAVIKQQFILTKKGDKYYIEDPNSSNGTFLGSVNLKQSPPVILKDGDEIIVPIEENGKLIQLKIYFQIRKKSIIQKPSIKKKKKSQIPAIKKPDSTSVTTDGQYYDPTISPTVAPPIIRASNTASYQYKSFIYDPNDSLNTSNSFIMVQRAMIIPPNAFSPNSGLDLSIIYKLEKSEFWHILVAFGLLLLMIYRYYINIMVVMIIIASIESSPLPSLTQIFVEPLPIALIFGFSFIVHEYAHLQTAKHFKYQSRFCLTKVGVKATLKWALIGLPFGLPGAAVSIGVDPEKDKNEMGAIKIAGPLSNFILGLIFMIIAFILPIDPYISIKMIVIQASSLNFVLGSFNMIPREVKGFALDGKFILQWNKPWYFTLLVALLSGFVIAIVLSNSLTAQLY